MICENCAKIIDKIETDHDTQIVYESMNKEGKPCKEGPFFAPTDFDHIEPSIELTGITYKCGYCGYILDPIIGQKIRGIMMIAGITDEQRKALLERI